MTQSSSAQPAYGLGTGDSPLAVGADAFVVPPERQIDIITDTGFTRRQRRSNRQELGFEPEAAAGYPGMDTGIAAALPLRRND